MGPILTNLILDQKKLYEMLTVSIKQIPIASYALAANNVAIIRSITVNNNTPENYERLKVKITFDPQFADTVEEHIISLPAHESWMKPDIRPAINASYLCNLTEKISAKTTVQVLSKDGEVLAETKKELEVLDYCQYWGNSFMSQYLAAFVTPRHIALDPIIKRASEILAKWTGSSSLTAYTRDVPNRPKMIIGALYEAISEQNITYCYPTMTLARHGQKIRTCEELLSEDRGKRGCCLDMALLMCSCLEAVGMHPLLIMQDDHAFAGCWLVNDMFTDSVNDDPSVITKRTAEGINEILLVETTGANEGNAIPFDKAVAVANDSIRNVEKFSFVLDVARARLAGVHPIPQRIYNGHEYEVINQEPDEHRHRSPDGVSETFSFKKDENEFSRFDLWERRLLDLSTRNNLLNIRFSNNTLRIMVASLPEIVQLLYRNKDIHIIDRPDDCKSSADSNDLGERFNLNDSVMDLLRKEMEKDTLRSYKDPKALSKTLTSLYRSARLSIEESGANTLYIALGFLKWFEPGKSFPHFAPIVLYPIRLERKSANKGYYIVSRGEDPLLNETLCEFLKQNYDIRIPDVTSAIQDEKGVDIKYILAAVRKAVMEQDKWDVIEESAVSIFDFNRFVIWNDIRTNRESMSRHPLIDSLVSGRLSKEMTEESVKAEELPSEEIALPISADSSQLAAISAAASGKSFVLHGPPGTGKSQTITNIIANALFHGKRVLFVAEKMAALEVVQKRLADIGLAPFCLELHSNKTKKSLVMDQLRKTTEVVQQMGDDTFTKEAAHLDELKQELDSHVKRLHKVYPCGLSIYDCFAKYSEINVPECSNIRLPDSYIGALTPESLRDDTELLENYQSAAGAVAEYAGSLKEIGTLVYSPDIRCQIQKLIGDILEGSDRLKELADSVVRLAGCDIGKLSKPQYEVLELIAEFMVGNEVPSGLISVMDNDLLKALDELTDLRGKLDVQMSELLARYDRHILDVDHKTIRRRWIEAERKWFLAKYLDRRDVVNTLSSYIVNGERIDESEIVELCDRINDIQRLQNDTNDILDFLCRTYNIKRELKDADTPILRSYREKLAMLQSAIQKLQPEESRLIDKIAKSIASQWKSISETSIRTLEKYIATYKDFSAKVTSLEELTAASLTQYGEDWLDGITRIIKRWDKDIVNLRSKVAYNVVRRQVCERGLDAVAEAFESGAFAHNDIVNVYLKGLYRQCADRYISQDKELSFFQSILFEDKIKRFRKLCKEFEDTTRRELVIRLSAMLPALRKEASQSSDVGFLQKCIRNGCRGVSIRKLFETIPDLISRMCPAMLMSPLSVSQYLGPDWPQFDLVIFDEASQMPTCEAVAAISRGEGTVIVGDEHQLPPTSFFMAENFSEQHSESEDLESILEDCLALSMPQKYLLWHYRSRHESLITFSNKHFYNNSLLTFPSNDDMETKVSFEYVKGVYKRGTERNNREEAQAVVHEIKRRLSAPRTSSQSIGVVTFNVNQQSLIEDLLNDMFRKNPDLEAISEKMHEPIFIKNLENVQGDERDVILFSVGYGRDKFGKVAMNFGPLNRDGGERRLNVAVSRARCEMKIFSSLKAEDIDLYRSDSKGVQYLRSFLEYAERGKVALLGQAYGKKPRTKDAFVESVAEALRAKGYCVNTNIGSSEYRVDIGIIDPDNRERYLLGVICDGYNYAASDTAHDRDVTAPAVLSLLGWRTYNIWSVEWWDTPEHVLNGIVREIERVKSDNPAEVGTYGKRKEEEKAEENNTEGQGNIDRPEDINNGGNIDGQEDINDEGDVDGKNKVNIPHSAAKEYVKCNLPVRSADSALFSQGHYTGSVIKDIRTILDAEAPISRRLLIKRLLSSYGISRNGVRINAYLTKVFQEMGLFTTGTEDIFFWKDREQLENYAGYRLASERESLDIAPEEVAQAIFQVLKEQFAIGEEGLVSETARQFGYASVRDNVLASMRRGIGYSLENNLISLDGGKYRLMDRKDD